MFSGSITGMLVLVVVVIVEIGIVGGFVNYFREYRDKF